MRHKPGNYTGPLISPQLYISLEMKRYIESTETPGLYGYFTADEAAE
jgi:hypothetical protein